MLPVILVAVGAYLIGDSVLGDKKYDKGGEVEWSNEENEKLGKWLLSTKSGKHIISESKNSEELEKNVRDYANDYDGIAGLSMDDEDEGFEWVTFDDLYNEIHSRKEKGGYMAKGGKLVGKQKNLDVNKNGKLDAEDFKILRGEKMAKGGKAKDYDGEKYRVADVYYSDRRKDLFIVTESKPTYIVVKYKDGFVDKITKTELKELKESGDLDYIDKNENLLDKYIFKDAFAKGGETKMPYKEFEETLREYEIEGGFGKTIEKGYEMYYLPKGNPYLNTKFNHRNKKKAYQQYVKMDR